MKYVIIRIKKGEWKCIFSSDDKQAAIHICNDYNRLDATARYTVYEESEV